MSFILRINHNNFTYLNEITPLVTKNLNCLKIIFICLHNQLDMDIQVYIQIHIGFYGYDIFGFKIKLCSSIINFRTKFKLNLPDRISL